MKTILPNLGIVQASEPSTYLLTPFQDGEAAYLAFLSQATRKVRMMIYAFTLDDVVQRLIALRGQGLDVKCIFDRSQAGGRTERTELQRLVAAGFVDGKDFLVGTSPLHHEINHLKATWLDDKFVLHGSWNYSTSASAQYNSIEMVESPELAALFDQAFAFAWNWILQNESSYQTLRADAPPKDGGTP